MNSKLDLYLYAFSVSSIENQSEVPNIRVLNFLLGFVLPTLPYRTYTFLKNVPPILFLPNKSQKIPTYTPLLRPTRSLMSEKTSIPTQLLGPHVY